MSFSTGSFAASAATLSLPPLWPPPGSGAYHLPAPPQFVSPMMPLGAYTTGLTLPPPMPSLSLAPQAFQSYQQLPHYPQVSAGTYFNTQQYLPQNQQMAGSSYPTTAPPPSRPLGSVWGSDLPTDILSRLPKYCIPLQSFALSNKNCLRYCAQIS